jgi:hypothetical protein
LLLVLPVGLGLEGQEAARLAHHLVVSNPSAPPTRGLPT